jgi:uncharacterized membrane protein YdjX (TVP38/TMEM64 family)
MLLKRIARSCLTPQFWLLVGLVAMLAIAVHHFHLSVVIHSGWRWFNALITKDPVIFIIFFNLATLFCLPASLLALSAGYTFGLGWGTVYVLISAIIGATLAFWMGRYLARPWMQQKMQRNIQLRAIAQAVVQEGWKLVLLTRLSPLFPFNLTSYAFGATQISLKNYSLGSLGLLPGTILYTYMGSLTSELTTVNLSAPSTSLGIQMAQWGMRLVGLAATFFLTFYLHRIAKKALHQRLALESEPFISPPKL